MGQGLELGQGQGLLRPELELGPDLGVWLAAPAREEEPGLERDLELALALERGQELEEEPGLEQGLEGLRRREPEPLWGWERY